MYNLSLVPRPSIAANAVEALVKLLRAMMSDKWMEAWHFCILPKNATLARLQRLDRQYRTVLAMLFVFWKPPTAVQKWQFQAPGDTVNWYLYWYVPHTWTAGECEGIHIIMEACTVVSSLNETTLTEECLPPQRVHSWKCGVFDNSVVSLCTKVN